ncbi:exonuclease SbcCD subunit D [Atopobiaceae bacterium 24-176]
MRLLHVSDLHAGKRLHGYLQEEDLAHVLTQVVDVCRERSVDCVLVAGDIYDAAQPPDYAVALVDGFLRDLVSAGVQVVAVPGNHDSAARVGFASPLLAASGVYVAGPLKGPVEPVVFSDAHGEVRVWPVPFVRPATVRAALGCDAASPTEALGAVVETMGIDEAVRNVCVAHQFVTSGSVGPVRSESELSLGDADNVEVSVFDPFDYVALGHLHRPQKVGRETVRYSGTPLKYSRGEAKGSKSMVLVDLGEKRGPGDCDIAWELVPFEPLHDLRHVRGALEELVSPDVVDAAPADDYVAVTLTDDTLPLDALGRLQEAYPNLLSLEHAPASLAAAEEAQVRVPDSSLDLAGLFAEFFEVQRGHAMDDRQRAVLAECAALAKEGE